MAELYMELSNHVRARDRFNEDKESLFLKMKELFQSDYLRFNAMLRAKGFEFHGFQIQDPKEGFPYIELIGLSKDGESESGKNISLDDYLTCCKVLKADMKAIEELYGFRVELRKNMDLELS